MAEWVLAVERAYVATATSKQRATVEAPREPTRPRALAAIGAVASRYLAVGTPRTMGLIIDDASRETGALSIEAHRTWFKPSDIRCALVEGANPGSIIDGTRATSLAEALACDIVCVHAQLFLDSRDIRRGTHINVLTPGHAHGGAMIGDELEKIADITHEVPGLGQLAAGFVDGRQLDEITIFVVGDAAIATAALA